MFGTNPIHINILVVNDDPAACNELLGLLQKVYDCERASTQDGALGKIRDREFSVVICDVGIAAKNGFDLIHYVDFTSPKTVVILTGKEIDSEETLKIFRAGAFDYFPEPFDIAQVETTVKRAAEQYELKSLKDHYQVHLEELISERTVELDKALQEVEASYRMALKALVQALETRDFETHGHSERVVTFSLRLGHELGLSKEDLRDLELGALLHDIGKIGVPDAILRKPAKLTEEEWVKMKLHPLHGQKILRNIPFLEGSARVVEQHHEKWDGSGYPHGMRGEDIDLNARIFQVVDAFDAMTSDRVYRRGTNYEEALKELERCSGTQFDPFVVEAFRQIPQEDWNQLRKHSITDRTEVSSFQSIVTELVASAGKYELVH
ncbi:MAG TPA: HD domain-containing phosphohydrolase [Pyrinomonadaceae bacterium]|jgi:response regulator RpfG family c-di-GMP phosphodiesterase|nr:HD domain-containing phosphohydrolase [Pyrinomonadaceae bacterium]